MDSNFVNVQEDQSNEFSAYPRSIPKQSAVAPSYDTTSIEPVTYQNESSANAMFNTGDDDDFASVTPLDLQNQQTTNTFETTNYESSNLIQNNVEEYTALDQNNINEIPEIPEVPSSYQNEATTDFNAYETTNYEQSSSNYVEPNLNVNLNVANEAVTSDYQMNSLEHELVEQGTEVSNINYSLKNASSTVAPSSSEKIVIKIPVKKIIYVQKPTTTTTTSTVSQVVPVTQVSQVVPVTQVSHVVPVTQVSQVPQMVPVAPMPQLVPISPMPQMQMPQMQIVPMSMSMTPSLPMANTSYMGAPARSSIYQSKVYVRKI